MKHEPTDERRALIRQIMKRLGPHTSLMSRDLTEAELHEQSTHFLRTCAEITEKAARRRYSIYTRK